MTNPADVWRRWFGLLFLFIAVGMLIWGQTLLKPHLSGIGYLFYWLGCFAFTLLALFTALLDVLVLRQRAHREQRELYERSLGDAAINKIKKERRGSSGQNSL